MANEREAQATKYYVDDGWEHIFSSGEAVVRFVLAMEPGQDARLVDVQLARARGWTPLPKEGWDDLLDSLKDNQIVEHFEAAVNGTLDETSEQSSLMIFDPSNVSDDLPNWAIQTTRQHVQALRSMV